MSFKPTTAAMTKQNATSASNTQRPRLLDARIASSVGSGCSGGSGTEGSEVAPFISADIGQQPYFAGPQSQIVRRQLFLPLDDNYFSLSTTITSLTLWRREAAAAGRRAKPARGLAFFLHIYSGGGKVKNLLL